MFNTATQEVRRYDLTLKLSDSDKKLKFSCFCNQSYATRKGEMIALVYDPVLKYYLISYRHCSDTISILHTYSE